jgi:ribosome-binding protein aMBF1 (putative translation factor)
MTKEELQKQIGKRIVELREQQGIRQIDLASKLEIEDSALRRIESGRTNCTIWTLYKICNCLEIDLNELFLFKDK